MNARFRILSIEPRATNQFTLGLLAVFETEQEAEDARLRILKAGDEISLDGLELVPPKPGTNEILLPDEE